MKKIFVFSDNHGHCKALMHALSHAGFDAENEEHLLVGCGDYFDRGDENMQVLRFLERIPRKVLLRGNHEDMLLELLQTGRLQPHHYLNGTLQTLQDLFGKYVVDPASDTLDLEGKTGTVDRMCDFIGQTVDHFETEGYFFVHGWVPEGCQTAAQCRAATPKQWAMARWTRWSDAYDLTPPLRDKTLVCGHMPTFFAKMIDPSRPAHCDDIFYGNGMIAIDGATHSYGRVNVLVLEQPW